MNPRVRHLVTLAQEFKFVTACVVVVALTAAASTFLHAALSRLERQQAQARDEGMAVLKTLASANSLRSDRAYIEEAVKDIDRNLVTEDNLADNVGYFYKIEEQTSAHISDLRPQTVSPANAESRYKLVPVSFSVTGSFAQVVAFVHQVEHGPRLMKITGFSVRRRQPASNVITMDLNVEMLGRP